MLKCCFLYLFPDRRLSTADLLSVKDGAVLAAPVLNLGVNPGEFVAPLSAGRGHRPATLNGFPLQALINSGHADESIDNPSQGGAVAENGRHEIEIEYSDQAPVQSADYEQDGCDNVY
jgi:hypothetical protein